MASTHLDSQALSAAPLPLLGPPTDEPSRRQRWIDLGLVMLVAFALPIASSLYTLFFHPGDHTYTNAGIFRGVLQECIALAVFAVLFRRQGHRLSRLGWSPRWIDLALGLGLVIASFTAMSSAYFGMQAGWHFLTHKTLEPGHHSNFAASLWLLVPFLILNPFFEEILVRGYLVTALMDLRLSVTAATLVSIGVQTSYHLYYGVVGALTVGAGLAVLALYYARTRNLAPVIVAHFLWDLTALFQA